MKLILVTLLISCTLVTAYTQDFVKGKVLNAETGESIAYVNIGITARLTGTVSQKDGSFNLKFKEKDDRVTISSIGYTSQEVTVAKLLNKGFVKLKPKVHEFKEVQVIAANYGGAITLGDHLDQRYKSIGFTSDELGAELAALIEVNNKVKVETANFILNNSKKEGVLFRVNIYDFKNGEVGENLLKENVIIRSPGKKGTITVDLSTYNIIVENDVLLSLELLQEDSDSVRFNSRQVFSGRNTYIKLVSNTHFRQMSKISIFMPRRSLGFYFEGTEILE